MDGPAHDPVELLHWYMDAGVDIALQDEPIDRFAASKQAEKSAPQQKRDTAPRLKRDAAPNASPPQAAATKVAMPDSAAIDTAKEAAAKAETLDELKSALETFEGCNLKFTARSTVFADGSRDSRLMIIGEAPGRDEDEQGLPFVGRSGQWLNRILGGIELAREDVYITNVIAWRPPGNRAPTPMETEICRPFIERHIELKQPEVILLLGGSSTKAMLKTTKGILSLRGKWADISIGGRDIPTLPSLHPAYLLRQPQQKKLVWQDMLSLQKKLEG